MRAVVPTVANGKVYVPEPGNDTGGTTGSVPDESAAPGRAE